MAKRQIGKRRVSFRVSFELPPDCRIADAQQTLCNHLSWMGGDLRPPGAYSEEDPGDPMFGMNRKSIKVARMMRRS